MRPSLHRQIGSHRVVLGAPCGIHAVIVYLAIQDTLQSPVESRLAPRAGSSIRKVGKITCVTIHIPQQTHDIGHQIVIESDIVLVTKIARERPILTPPATTFLRLKNHLYAVECCITVLRNPRSLVKFGEETNLLGRCQIVQTGMCIFF